MKRPKISVVIPSYKQKKTIGRTIESLLSQEFTDFEIVIVDSSDDETREIIRSYVQKDKRIRLIERANRTPAGLQRNIGIKASRADIIATTDTDCILHKDWLKRIHESLSESRPVIGGSFGNANPGSIVGWISYLVEFNHFFPGNPSQEVEHLAGGNISFLKSVFDKYGGFPISPHSADIMVIHKWRQKGVPVWFDPSIRLDHVNRTSLKSLLNIQFRLGRSSVSARKSRRAFSHGVAQHPYVFPFLWAYRYVSIISRLCQWNLKELVIYLLLTPLIIATLLVWNAGFIYGYFFPFPISD